MTEAVFHLPVLRRDGERVQARLVQCEHGALPSPALGAWCSHPAHVPASCAGTWDILQILLLEGFHPLEKVSEPENCSEAKLVLALAGLWGACLGHLLQQGFSSGSMHREGPTNSFLTEAAVATSSSRCCTALPGAEALCMSQSQAGQGGAVWELAGAPRV